MARGLVMERALPTVDSARYLRRRQWACWTGRVTNERTTAGSMPLSHDDCDDEQDSRAGSVWGTRVHALRRGTVSAKRDGGAGCGPVPCLYIGET